MSHLLMMELKHTYDICGMWTDYRAKEKKEREQVCVCVRRENNIDKKPVDSMNKIDKIQATKQCT